MTELKDIKTAELNKRFKRYLDIAFKHFGIKLEVVEPAFDIDSRDKLINYYVTGEFTLGIAGYMRACDNNLNEEELFRDTFEQSFGKIMQSQMITNKIKYAKEPLEKRITELEGQLSQAITSYNESRGIIKYLEGKNDK